MSSRFKHSLDLLKLFCSRDAILFAWCWFLVGYGISNLKKFYCKNESKNDILY
ncbi:hypothetical protein HPHPA9_0678 [Helicobacter pylori Hp A-9]|uniref:Uncharacterized protein n=1 Tax=Helicobacter pylori Hp A-9 TaxID=992034 RepID=I9RE94_HELPX|nr:hypothetical protein HPHPA9_0678 [Helicobacter pylori Hp A-9]